MASDPKIIVALDYASAELAARLTAKLDPGLCRVKVGKELFTVVGPAWVENLAKQGYDVFLDLKFHDIPNTVAQACKSAANLGVWMMNVHAAGGRSMMLAARDALATLADRPKLIAVTVLTSMTAQDLHDIGVSDTPSVQVQRLAQLTQSCGLDGVVCSALEVTDLRKTLGLDFCLVTPGIRPDNSSSDDQSRIATPKAAMDNGSSYLVIGRPITQAPDPLAALNKIISEIA